MTYSLACRDAVSRGAAVFVLTALLLVVLGHPALSQSGGAVTLAKYRATLEQLRSEIASAKSGDTQEAVSRGAASLAVIQEVELADGRRLPLQPLFGSDDSQQRALSRIDAVLAQLNASAGDDSTARLAALDRVLASDALHPDAGLLSWLRRLFEGRDASGAESAANGAVRALNILIAVAGGLVAVFLIGRIVQAVLGAFLSEADARANEGAAASPLTGDAARRRASDLAQAGSYREAVRLLYLATLLSLEDRGLLRLDRSLTNREVLASVGHRREVQAGLRPVVDVFETVWYGEREPDRATFERYALAVETAAAAIAAAEPVPASNPAEAT